METNIKQKIDLIAECIFTKVQTPEDESFDYGLYSGKFGILLFLLYYSRFSKTKKHLKITENYAERLFEQFIIKEKLHTFCSGLSGILYLFEFLRENNFIDMDVNSVQPALNDYLVFQMRKNMSGEYFDFMHGALGVGLYFLKKRTGLEYIRELIDFLYATALKSDNNHIFKWESFVMDKDENFRTAYNFALSHGMSSIIIFLSRVINSGISDDRIIEMLSGSIDYFYSQEKDFLQFGSYFPSCIFKDSPEDISKSRLGWCYGDLGVGIALCQAGKAINKPKWKNKGLEILLQSTQRRNLNENFVRDAGICHGSAGIALIYRRLFLETHRDEFKEATDYWIQQTLNFSTFKDGLVGYKTLKKREGICDYSLLTGISGIGLVLLSYLGSAVKFNHISRQPGKHSGNRLESKILFQLSI